MPVPFQDTSNSVREISEAEKALLAKQDARPVPPFRAKKFQDESCRHWDIFYKRNETRFFKDRHWTKREFSELSGLEERAPEAPFVLMEVGCGVGNFFFPLLAECPNLEVLACDFSARAVALVRENSLYEGGRVTAFRADITRDRLYPDLTGGKKADAVSLVFVLSAVAPDKFGEVLRNLAGALKEEDDGAGGGKILFRDYAENDMAMIRFGAGTKLGERHYLRQDGTTSYFFRLEELEALARGAGLRVSRAAYVRRRTVNRKEGVDAERTFLQAVMTLEKQKEREQ